MKIEFAPKTFRIFRGTVLLIAVVLVAYVAYAASQLSVNNSVTITAANGIGVSITTTNPGTCPALNSASYQTATFTNTNSWTIPAGGSSSQFFCLENTGTGNDPTPSITLGTTSIAGLTVATTPMTIPAISAGSVSAPVTVTANVPAAATGSGTFSLTVS
jgi:uncharacterized membrane protein